MAAEPACKITRYHCKNQEESKKIADLVNTAIAQQTKDPESFIDIFPWLGACDLAEIHYVAQKADGTICGWMSVKEREWKKRKFLYLSEITTIRTIDESYKGVGKRLHDQLVHDAKDPKGKGFLYDFIYLYPLNEKVKATYKDKWGYKDLFPGDKKHEHLYLKLKADPTPALKLDMLPKDQPRVYTIQAYRYAAKEPEDRDLINVIAKNRRDVLSSEERWKELADVIGTVEMYEYMGDDAAGVPNLQERRKLIRDVFEPPPPPSPTAGRRKTRRHRRAKRTRRSHRR